MPKRLKSKRRQVRGKINGINPKRDRRRTNMQCREAAKEDPLKEAE